MQCSPGNMRKTYDKYVFSWLTTDCGRCIVIENCSLTGIQKFTEKTRREENEMKKALALVLAVLLLGTFTACTGTGSSAAETTTAETTAAAAADTAKTSYRVGICQLVQHPALDAATEGFKAALTEALGDSVTFDEQNASGESTSCATIVNGFVASKVDLIMANATAPLQAAVSATGTIPILGTSVTDYASALEIDNWNGTVGTNVSGTSDLAPLDQQAAMLRELFPEAKTVGLLYCSAESNSKYQVDVIRGYLEQEGLTCEEFAFTDTNDVSSVTQKACDKSDVLYIPTDNTAASNTEAIANVVLPAKVPVVAGEEGICSGCGVATLSISYYDLGYTTGKMAVKILTGEADVSTMPVEYAPQVTKKYNAANCEALGITPPERYTAIEG